MTTEKQGASIIDQAMHYLNLCIPAVLLMFGLFSIIIGTLPLIGSTSISLLGFFSLPSGNNTMSTCD